MPDLLLELFSEEIPARMQRRAEDDLNRLMGEALAADGLTFAGTRTFSGPRRLGLIVTGLSSQSQAAVDERKGPRVGAPEKAIAGFLRAAGLSSLDECETANDGKGEFYVARIDRPGRPAAEIVAEAVAEAVTKFPWPKSMRWGSGRLRWVRPLQAILCVLDGKVVPVEIDGLRSGDVTYGHRFLSGRNATDPKAVTIRHTQDYETELLQVKVVASRDARADAILSGAKRVAQDAALDLVEDHGLLDENAGLVEWPVVLSGSFPASFLDVPPEILMTAMRTHQKCFSLKDPATGALANRFILVSNLEAPDGGKAIIAGNERVIRARLSDAKFFWANDRARPLENLLPLLGSVTFHEKLGTQLQRVERIEALARELARVTGADPEKPAEAARLAKADLMSETVGEFPELQGLIGRYLALAQGIDAEVAEAIAAHYKPQGPSDAVPSAPVAIAVALADKLDMLVGFWAIDEKPTGSKDPYALRRAALGVIRIVLENNLRLPLFFTIDGALALISVQSENRRRLQQSITRDTLVASGQVSTEVNGRRVSTKSLELLDFFADRLKVYLRDKGARHDLIDAVFALPGQDDLLMIVRRVDALGRFLDTAEGASLLALVRRALNILKIEEKKDATAFDGKPAPKLLRNREEKALAAAIKAVGKDVETALKGEDFEAAMAALAGLREPVDIFFEHVTVNADDADLRANRLKLLGQIRALTLNIADFSRIEG